MATLTCGTRLLAAAPYSTVWRWARGKQRRAFSPSPHTQHLGFWRKGNRRNKEVSQKGSWEGQGTAAPVVMDSCKSPGS